MDYDVNPKLILNSHWVMLLLHTPVEKALPKKARPLCCRKSCRVRWVNYICPFVKRGHIFANEEDLIIRLHRLHGNRWSLIAGMIYGRYELWTRNNLPGVDMKMSHTDPTLLCCAFKKHTIYMFSPTGSPICMKQCVNSPTHIKEVVNSWPFQCCKCFFYSFASHSILKN